VAGLLTDLRVFFSYPFLTAAFVNIGRGVKQGCPLSPLLFIIVIDTIIHLIMKEPRICIRAYADDIGFGFSADFEECLLHITNTIEAYCRASGAAVNQKKTVIVTTLPPGPETLAAKTSSAWPQIKFVNQAKYLGMLFGNNITTTDIFNPSLVKFRERIESYMPLRPRLSVSKRILIANTFLLPIFSYLHQFYLIPHNLNNIIDQLLFRFIIPFSSLPLRYVRYPLAAGGLRRPLRDHRLANIASLAAQAIADIPQARFLPRSQLRNTTIITKTDTKLLFSQHKMGARQIATTYLPPTQPFTYKNLLNSPPHIASCNFLSTKGHKWGLNTAAVNSSNFLANIKLLPASINDAIRLYQVQMFSNGVATKTRTRHWVNHLSLDCPLCPSPAPAHSDNLRHYYSHSDCDFQKGCIAITTAKAMASLATQSPQINKLSLHDHSLTRNLLNATTTTYIALINHAIWIGRTRTNDSLDATPAQTVPSLTAGITEAIKHTRRIFPQADSTISIP
jgi:hypothetical protein